MNTYKITFSRENGTTGTDHFTAATEAQARRDFREVYRHGKGGIIDIELVSTDAPATKQQEREALDKIRKLVEQLGPDSYLATTFEGCFQLAAENIDNDGPAPWPTVLAALKSVRQSWRTSWPSP